MNWKKLVVIAAMTTGIVGAGCGGDGNTTPTVELCSSGTCDTHTYLTNVLSIPQMDTEGHVPGFNIDGTDATVCNQMDAMGPAPDNITGVDNSVGPTLGGLVGSMIQDNVDDGSVLLIMQLDGVDSFTNDDRVKLTVLLAEVPEGATINHDASGRISAGQAFDVNELSYSDAAHTMAAVTFDNGKIVNGRFQAGPDDFPLSISLMGASLSLTVHSTQIRFNVSESGITAGVLGGGLNVDEVNNTVMNTPALAEYADVVATTLSSFADLEPNGEGVCQDASVAMEFGGVGAMLTSTVVASPSAAQ